MAVSFTKIVDRRDSTEHIIAPESTAAEFSTTQAYSIGDFCFHEGVLYEFIAIHAAGAWDASQVKEAVIGDELTNLKDTLNQLPTEETGQELLSEEKLNTLYEGAALDTLSRIFDNLPQDETADDLYDELVTENSWLDQLYREVAASMA